jgi:aspartate-semialdehyde dehydrogenase
VSRAALLQPLALLGKELRDTLGARPLFSDVRLLSARDDEIGNLTDIGGAAAFVARLDADSLENVDVAFCCGTAAETRQALPLLPAGTTAVILSTDATVDDGRPVVAGVNAAAVRRGERLLSPHPAVVLLAHLLAPLRALAVEEAVATAILPASMHGDPGIDELFEQTRQILTMTQRRPSPVFGAQLAFNLLPVRSEPGSAEPLAAQLRAVLGGDPPVALQLLQGSVFHSLAASVHVRCAQRVDAKALRKVLGQHPFVELARKPGHLGPIDAAAHDKVLVGAVQEDSPSPNTPNTPNTPGAPGSYWLWAMMDNLTRGGALNALALAEEAL